ncbi:hypothetical protein PV10_03268 [Exophiala mesophila]|uniref:GPI anchored protein n=1 Tax=Exophiala mesophila TaxID=212818 RepID=A0A0D1Y4Q4_EXOME|nr:uncharacterized protein PV10_03268 [Exophiala mesophila]KIV95641.1 hypothetical protein PV10_03268 [Exophiala mesophila]
MKFLSIVAALFAATVTAQLNNAISIPEGSSTLDVTAGEPLTIEWTNPSRGTVTIKLQQEPVTPDGGIVLLSGVPASLLGATVQIPDAEDVNSFQYTIQIIDDTDPNNYNFSPNFGITGATGTAVATDSTASATGSTASATGSTASASSTGTSSEETASETSTDSSSATTTGTTTGTSSSEATTTSRTTTSTSSATTAAATTSAPDGNGADSVKVQGGFLALAVGALIAVA